MLYFINCMESASEELPVLPFLFKRSLETADLGLGSKVLNPNPFQARNIQAAALDPKAAVHKSGE